MTGGSEHDALGADVPAAYAGLRLAGTVALVTGAGSETGIGFAAARLLAGRGAHVVVTATTQRVHERATDCGGAGVVADLTVPAEAARAVEFARAAFGPVDILVNCAGWQQSGTPTDRLSFVDLDDALWGRALDLNLTIAARMCRLVIPGMAERGGGRIVNVSSVTGPLVAQPGMAGYAAGKAGVEGLTRALAIELGPQGIRANCVAPGSIETGALNEEEQRAARNTPAGRAGRPDEVAEVIAWLASSAASYLNGVSIVVDGGNIVQELKT